MQPAFLCLQSGGYHVNVGARCTLGPYSCSLDAIFVFHACGHRGMGVT
tara:strand:- start:6 stop:149 length:144 start_codon:yes stop_codon:yes gene_type:complete